MVVSSAAMLTIPSISNWVEEGMMMKMIYVLVMLCATFALVACGGDDEPALVPTSAPTTVPTEVAVIPATEPAPGSDQEALLLLLERSVEAERAGDWQAIRDMCNPELREKITVDQVRQLTENPPGSYSGRTAAPPYDPENTSFRNVEVKLYGEDTAVLAFDMWQHDTEVSKAHSVTYTKTDGKWYRDGSPCVFLGF